MGGWTPRDFYQFHKSNSRTFDLQYNPNNPRGNHETLLDGLHTTKTAFDNPQKFNSFNFDDRKQLDCAFEANNYGHKNIIIMKDPPTLSVPKNPIVGIQTTNTSMKSPFLPSGTRGNGGGGAKSRSK